jgi:hypothetical protein
MLKRRPINFRLLRDMIEVRQVLALLHSPCAKEPNGDWRGPCPIHGSHDTSSRSLDVKREIAHCHRCGWRGDALQLWTDYHKMDRLDAAYDLCDRLRIDPPYLTQ